MTKKIKNEVRELKLAFGKEARSEKGEWTSRGKKMGRKKIVKYEKK